VSEEYLNGYIAGQWEAADRLLNLINSFHGPLRRKDMYRLIMDFRPRLPEFSS